MAGIGQDLKKIYSDETRIVENASLCTVWVGPPVMRVIFKEEGFPYIRAKNCG